MKQNLKVNVYGAASTTVEGTRHTKIWCGMQDPEADPALVKGIDLFSVKCDGKVYDSLELTSYPAPCTIEVQLKRGAKNSMTQYCVGLTADSNRPSPKS